MAYLQWRHSVNTTEGKLRKFFCQNLFFASVLTTITIVFCIFSETRYEQLSTQQLELNHFYLEFEKLHSSLYSYSSKVDSTLSPSISERLSHLRSSMDFLLNLKISTIYQRDIGDVSNMLDLYTSYAREVLSCGSSPGFALDPPSWIFRINNAFYRTQTVYESINAEFRSLYSQILEFSRIAMEQIRFQHRLFITLIILVLVFMVLAEFFYSHQLSHAITAPIKELTSSIRGFNLKRLADYKAFHLSSESNLEMNFLVEVFNMMLITLQDQVKKIQENADLEIELHKKEVENLQIANLLRSSALKSLQMQINPHFLFNTLNMISQSAYLEGADKTSALLDSTAVLLRYTLDFATRSVPLSKEIEVLGIYVSLQEQRFGGRIRFTFDLDESFHHIKVPALILQPLVENSITHGIGMYLKDASVTICTQYDSAAGAGLIRIIDNGIGLTQEQLEKVREEMKKSDHADQKIGLSNVYARLHIFFYGKASMEIYSIPNVKTEVVLSLPCSLP